MGLGEGFDLVPDFGQRVAPVGREMLGDAQGSEKGRVMRHNLHRGLVAVEIAQEPGNGFDHEGIGIAGEVAPAVGKPGVKPQFGQTAGDESLIGAVFRREGRALTGQLDQIGEPVLTVLKDRQLAAELSLFFREVHDAENTFA